MLPPLVLLRLPFNQNQRFASTPKLKIVRAIISSARKASEYFVRGFLSIMIDRTKILLKLKGKTVSFYDKKLYHVIFFVASPMCKILLSA